MAIKGTIIGDIGVEFEFPSLTEIEMNSFAKSRTEGWKPEHDGSTQREVLSIKSPFPGLHFSSAPAAISQYMVQEKSGAELVSPILRTDSRRSWKKEITDILTRAEDSYFGYLDPKCSIHFHVNMTGVPVYILQNIINIWERLEALIYRLSIAEMGYHRGIVRRNFLYCRPLNSPQVVIDGEHLRPSFDPKCLMKANNLAEFFLALGNTPTERDPDKYNPVRYGSVNFFNFIKYGTVEFRAFNLTYNPSYVLAWIDMCQAICKTALGKPFVEYDKMPLGYNGDFDIELLQVMLSLSDETMLALCELYYMNPWVEFVQPSWQFTHLPNNRASWIEADPKFIPEAIDGQEVRYYPHKTDDQYFYVTNINEFAAGGKKRNPPKAVVEPFQAMDFNAVYRRIVGDEPLQVPEFVEEENHEEGEDEE